jgi:hypothetical protein
LSDKSVGQYFNYVDKQDEMVSIVCVGRGPFTGKSGSPHDFRHA